MSPCIRRLRFRRLVAILAVALFALSVGALPAAACPSCGKAVAKQDNGRSLQLGYGASTLLLMSAPFVILGGLATLFSLEIRRAKLRAEAAGGVSPSRSSTASGDSAPPTPQTPSS